MKPGKFLGLDLKNLEFRVIVSLGNGFLSHRCEGVVTIATEVTRVESTAPGTYYTLGGLSAMSTEFSRWSLGCATEGTFIRS